VDPIADFFVGMGMIHCAIHKLLTLPFIFLAIASVMLMSCVDASQYDAGETTPQEEAEVIAPAWQSRLSPDIPYYNNTVGRVNVRVGPGIQFTKIGFIAPGEGGYIEGCNKNFEWCQISYNDDGDFGWVQMQYVAGHNS